MDLPQFDVGQKADGPMSAGPAGPGYYAEPPAKSRGCFFYGCIIALIVSGLGVVIVVASMALLWRFVNNQIKEYTDVAPVSIPVVTATDEQKTAVKQRWEDFRKAADEGKQAELVLDADDLNVLVEQEPKWKGKVFFSIKGEEITAQVSYPLKELKNPIFKIEDRFLNGTATITAELDEDGHLDVRVRDIEVKGKKLPPEVKTQFASENLARDFSRDPDNQRMLRRLRSVKVRDGKIHIRSRAKDEEAGQPATAEQIEAGVVEVLGDQLNVAKEKLAPGASLEELGADELDTTEIVMELEERFDVTLPDEQVEKAKTVGQLVELVKARVAAQSSDEARPDAKAPNSSPEGPKEKPAEKPEVPEASPKAAPPAEVAAPGAA